MFETTGADRLFEFSLKDLKKSLKTKRNTHFGEQMTDTEIILTRDLVAAHELLRQVKEVCLSEQPQVVVKRDRVESRAWYIQIREREFGMNLNLNKHGDVVSRATMPFETAYRVAREWIEKRKAKE